MKVFVSDINFEKDERSGKCYPWITGRLRSGLEIKIQDFFYDLQGYIGHHVEMLLAMLRSPYLEFKKGLNNQSFLPDKYYSVELIEELEKRQGYDSVDNGEYTTIIGEYIDSYTIPQKWMPLIKSESFKYLLRKPSAINTDDGIFLLYPFHLRKNVPVEMFPKIITIVISTFDLVAWHPLSESE